MRKILLVALAALPTMAAAQTPRDIANQLWPFGAPASANHAPGFPSGAHSGGDAADLARLAGSREAAARPIAAGPADAGFVSGFTAADLSRLRGNGEAASTLFRAPVATRIVAR